MKITNEGPRILRLCSDSEYSADPGEDVQISFPVLSEAQSPTRFALFRAWLRWCDKSHDCNKHAGESKLALPTRLLYVGDTDPNVLRLYRPENNDRVEYVALSHRWGEHPPTKNSPQFCTTDKNVKERRKRFNLSELPKTFRDAVRVTRELGIQYLWIDSLCIIQWNQEDWMREAKRMEDVFASAYCTIAATSAVDSNTGFLGRNVSGEYVCVQDASGRRFYVCTDIDDFDIDMEKVQLNKRAWVMQERVLSRRTIHFSDNQAYFECGEGVYCENLTRLESSRRKEFFMLDPNFPDRLLASGHQRTIEFIEFLFQDYSWRDLTVDADRCIAISGLEARIARARGCQNRYGIFQLYLHRNLLWQRSDNKKTERIGYKSQIVPSWSWMAYNGGIQFMDIPFGTVDWNESLRFDKKRELALITDVGVFRNCSLEQRDTSYDILDSSKAKRGSIQYDIEASKDIQAERCVVVAKGSHENEHGLGNRKYYILVVRSTSVVGEYMRVGVGWIRSDYVVKRRLNVRVV